MLLRTVRPWLGALLLNAPATILLVTVLGIVYLAANEKDIPAVLYAVVTFMALTDGFRRYGRTGGGKN